MTAKYFAILTNYGAAQLANAVALGTKLNISVMAVGDGGGALPIPDPAQTKLIRETRRAAVNQVSVDDKNPNYIISEQVIPENEGGWFIREIGLFDDKGGLIAVGNAPETYKPNLQEGSGRTQVIQMVLMVSSTESITLKIDPSVVLATREYVTKSIAAAIQESEKKAAETYATKKSVTDGLKDKYDKTGGNITGLVRIKHDGRGLVFEAPEKDSANYMEFMAGEDRIAYIGFGSQGANSLTFANTKTNVTLRVEEKVTVNGIPVMLESDKLPIGIFGEFPHRTTQLPAKWYSVNGDRFDITSPQGRALKSLPAQLKSDWGISEYGGKINLPNIKQPDGRTPFLRPVNGTSRIPGAVIRDEMRNLTGGIYFRQRVFSSGGGSPEIMWPMGGTNDAITTREYSATAGAVGLPSGAELQKTNTVELNAANQVPTGPEFKPLDIGITLAIYLGV
ncbi:phage tail protein [Citrobacter braakii]|uniref:phage tail protein n=1 Tax=Citrobacter braakii TaxID=57706 RepID=UPI0020CF413A|nr:phage tail protein [Citrobacter braakii]MDL4385836.1 phage tail protein [Citrobacter braakii]